MRGIIFSIPQRPVTMVVPFTSRPITGATQLLGLIGDPVRHSLSPIMQNAALTAMGLDYLYVPFPVKSADLSTVLAGFQAIDLKGFNITIPHKQAIFALLDQVSPIAQRVGAVNTVWRSEEQWCGTNTDVQGFMSPLQQQVWPDIDWVTVILGAGGAARAVVAGCQQLGCRTIYVAGRKVESLRSFEAMGTSGNANLIPLPWDKLPEVLPQAVLVVNTTPVGMEPMIQESPLAPEWIHFLKPEAIVYDLIYIPTPTLLLKLAQDHGLTTIDGLEMLIQQGAAALEIWTQQPVPVEIMRSALKEHLGQSHPL